MHADPTDSISAPPPQTKSTTLDALAERAAELLRLNDRGRYTVPSSRLYPHQWAWDSAFAAIGWGYLDLDRALTELESLLAGSWEDGRVPHIQFNPSVTESYFPDASFWQAGQSSSITQPPAWAIAARRLFELGADAARLRALLPQIERSHLFFARERDPLSWGLVSVAHPWESGLDNCPAWDSAMRAIDPERAPPFKRVDQEKVADPSMRPSDEEYRRYATIVKDITASGFAHGPFQVYCPLMTSILARAERDLAWLAEQLGCASEAAQRSAYLTEGLQRHLYDEALGRYRYFDIAARRAESPDVIGAYAPVFLPALEAHHDQLLAGLSARYQTPLMLPTTAPEHRGFNARCYWRGPVWININWLFADALEGVLPVRAQSLELMGREGFYEYYDPERGEGLGAAEFTWSAALCLDWIKRPS